MHGYAVWVNGKGVDLSTELERNVRMLGHGGEQGGVQISTMDDPIGSAVALFGRGAETWEVANVIVFLASDYSSYLSGEVISVSSQHP